LPRGWWIFGLDLALGEDIDIHQYRCAPVQVCDTHQFGDALKR